MTLNRTNHRIRPKFPDGTDREAVYKFYRNNADSLITNIFYVGLDHRVYDYKGPVKNMEADRIFDMPDRSPSGTPISHTIAICPNGKIDSVGSGYDLCDWEHISYIACSLYHIRPLAKLNKAVKIADACD